MTVEPKGEEIAIIETDLGNIVLGFLPEKAPNHVENFKKLAREGFYDGTKFHRVIRGFMIQGGCPNTKTNNPNSWGMGNPGYSIKAEFNNTLHVKGTLSMARSSDPNSAGSQFFICHDRASHLDGQYTAFGETLEGMNVVDKIATAPIETGTRDRPANPLTIRRVRIQTLEDYQKSKA